MKNKLNLVVAFLVLAFLTSCKTNKIVNSDYNKHPKIKIDCANVHWSHHKGEDGPENWKNLCKGFSDCGGKVQSPINIETKNILNENDLKAPKFSYGKSSVNIINNGHTVQFNVDGDNTVNLNGKDYKLLQFHYHAKSEHTINGNYYPIEVHFVHKHSDSDFAVLGIMFEEGKKNKLLAKYLDKFPTVKGEFKSEDIIDILSLFPKNTSYYNYKGSLTTPPCSEVVNWYVLKTPLTASKVQIEQFSKILNSNYRPIQLLNERIVKSFIE
ncbi:carbonic anhydrase [Lutibacter sp.]|uniref:carbonic anhydrase n=1 Tax=Lutibacter sp. TaxID=1925666 RepID=UPI0025BA737D|nr:carbonic anhydrase family protein [Lutibacter sp.]MCF6182847.1 carbonic anhydrase family protein [Lutibacter sp.]